MRSGIMAVPVRSDAWEIKTTRTVEPFDRGKALAQDRREMIRSAMRVVGRSRGVKLVCIYLLLCMALGGLRELL